MPDNGDSKMGLQKAEKNVQAHFDSLAVEYDSWKKRNSYYYDTVKAFYRHHVPAGSVVLEIGCGTGAIIESLNSPRKIGIDLSEQMLRAGKARNSALSLCVANAEYLPFREQFDCVIMPDILDHINDVWKVIKEVESVTRNGGVSIVNTINPLWGPILAVFEWLGMKMPEGPHRFINIHYFLPFFVRLTSFQIIEEGDFLFCPRRLLGLGDFLNFIIPRIPFVRKLCLSQYMMLKKEDTPRPSENNLSVAIIIPCHNEEKNILNCYFRIPQMNSNQEIIFVDDGSTDRTSEIIKQLMATDARVKLVSCSQRCGKGPAVKKGFDAATADVLMILDADMSVMPEDLPRFYEIINTGKGGLANGTRMLYPVQQSMNWLHVIGNRIFALLFSWILEQRISDTLCGTKAFLRKHCTRIYFSPRLDIWGDFDILFGVARLGLNIVEIPVQYQKRIHGYSKMQPLKHGFILLVRLMYGIRDVKWYRLRNRLRRSAAANE